MNEKKKLVIVIAALVLVMAVSVAVYDLYKDRVDPSTGQVSSDAMSAMVMAVATANEKPPVKLQLDTAPEINMLDAAGNAVTLSDFKGKPVVLNFWTSWCHYCQDEMDDFEDAYRQFGNEVQFVMLNVVPSEDNENDGRNFVSDAGYTFPAYYDMEGTAMTRYGFRGFPSTVFIDADGNIVEKHVGLITGDELRKSIMALIGG